MIVLNGGLKSTLYVDHEEYRTMQWALVTFQGQLAPEDVRTRRRVERMIRQLDDSKPKRR